MLPYCSYGLLPTVPGRQNNYRAQQIHGLTHADLKGRCVGLFASQRLPEVFGHVNDLFRLAEGQLVVVELKLALRRSHPSSACFRGPNQYVVFASSRQFAPHSSCIRMRALWRKGGGAAPAKPAAAELPAATTQQKAAPKRRYLARNKRLHLDFDWLIFFERPWAHSRQIKACRCSKE